MWRWSNASTVVARVRRRARARSPSGARGPGGSCRCGATSASPACRSPWRSPPPRTRRRRTGGGRTSRRPRRRGTSTLSAASRGSRRDLLLGPDRRLQARPDLGAVGRARRRSAQFVSSGSPGRKWNVNVSSMTLPGSAGVIGSSRLLEVGEHRGVGLARRPCPCPTRPSARGPRRCTGRTSCARTATPPGTYCVCGMIATSVTPGIALTLGQVVDAERLAVDRRRPADHRRQRVGDVEVHRELLAPGDDRRARRCAAASVPTSFSCRARLQLRRDGLRLDDGGLLGELAERRASRRRAP